MTFVAHTKLRTRLIAAVTLTTLPLMAWIWFGAQRQFERESVALEAEVQRLTAFIAGDVDHLLDATRQILIAVSEIDRTASAEDARAFRSALARQCPSYTGFGVIGLTNQPPTGRHPIYDPSGTIGEALIQRAMESDNVVVGTIQANSAGDSRLLTVAYAVRYSSNASPHAIAFAVLDLGWLESLLAAERVTGSRSLFPQGMVLNIIDRTGTVLTRFPDKENWTGKKFPDTAVLDAILRKGEGAAELTGIGGVRRFYAFQSVKTASDEILVSTGVSKLGALANARGDMIRSLAGVSVASILLILAAWFGTGLLITAPIARLVATTQRLATGDLSARTDSPGGPREITHLANAFDRMAEALQKKTSEQNAMKEKLIESDRQLRSMAMQAALAEEQERRLIAAGLHDKVGPLLATCFMKLGRLIKSPTPEAALQPITECRTLIDQTSAELRSLTFDLSSPALYTLGLSPAIEQLCKDIAKHHSFAVTFRDQGTPTQLSNDQRIVLYRGARELLMNVVKHAEAKHVNITCGGDAEEVFIKIADDGVGFDASTAGQGFSRTGGFGLFNLRERIEHLGGRFTIESSRGAGTCVIVAIPAPSQDTRKEIAHAHQGSTGG